MSESPNRDRLLRKDGHLYGLPDEELAAEYRRTLDNHYVGLLFERYMDVMLGIALKYLRNRQDAEDMLTVVFDKLLIALKEKEVDSFSSWLYVLVKNQCLSKLRRTTTERKRRQRYLDHISDIAAADTAFGSGGSILRQVDDEEWKLRTCLEALPSKQRKCLRYFYYEQKSYREIAVLIKENTGRVRSHIQNGRRNLRNMLRENREQQGGEDKGKRTR